MIQDVAYLLLLVHHVQADRDQAELHGRVEGDHELRAVVHQQGEPVPLLQPQPVQGAGQSVYPGDEFSVRDSLPFGNDGCLLGIAKSVRLQRSEDIHFLPPPLVLR